MWKILLTFSALMMPLVVSAEFEVQERGLQTRSDQLLTIVEGVQQMAALLRDSWNTGARAARALQHNLSPGHVARAMRQSDPIESLLSKMQLNNSVCRSRLICEVQSKLTSFNMGDLLYEVIKRKVPKLKKYGLVTARSLGATDCYQMFPCRFSTSPLMSNARHLRSLVEDFCDLSNITVTGRICRGIKHTVDRMEQL